MSIYGTDVFFEANDHDNKCAVWVEVSSDTPAGEWHRLTAGGRKFRRDLSRGCSCRCGPIRYQGSHVLPSDDDERAGIFCVDHIPGFIVRNGRDDGPASDGPGGSWWPWLRVWVAEDRDSQTVVLDRGQVAELHEYLGGWLARTDPARW